MTKIGTEVTFVVQAVRGQSGDGASGTGESGRGQAALLPRIKLPDQLSSLT